MAYVKRHPIKKTVNKSISYILDGKKNRWWNFSIWNKLFNKS